MHGNNLYEVFTYTHIVYVLSGHTGKLRKRLFRLFSAKKFIVMFNFFFRPANGDGN